MIAASCCITDLLSFFRCSLRCVRVYYICYALVVSVLYVVYIR